MNPEIEAKIVKDHPDQKDMRGTVHYWNFLPPDDLTTCSGSTTRVSHKTLRISKTLGIEGKKLLREDDDYEDLKNFSDIYEGQMSADEKMHIEWQDLLKASPAWKRSSTAFRMAFSPENRHIKPGTKAVFFCYARPALDKRGKRRGRGCLDHRTGDVQWYLYDVATGEIIEDAPRMIDADPLQARNAPQHRTAGSQTLRHPKHSREAHHEDIPAQGAGSGRVAGAERAGWNLN